MKIITARVAATAVSVSLARRPPDHLLCSHPVRVGVGALCRARDRNGVRTNVQSVRAMRQSLSAGVLADQLTLAALSLSAAILEAVARSSERRFWGQGLTEIRNLEKSQRGNAKRHPQLRVRPGAGNFARSHSRRGGHFPGCDGVTGNLQATEADRYRSGARASAAWLRLLQPALQPRLDQ